MENKFNPFKTSYIKYDKKNLDLILKKPKNQAYFVLILSFFTIAFFGFFAIRPTIKTILQLNREIQDNRDLNQKLSEKINALAQVQSDYELIRGAIPALYNAVPKTAEFPILVSTLEQIGQKTDASISAISINNVVIAPASARPGGAKEPTQVTFQAAYNGRYDQLLAALELLLNDKRIMTLDSVSFVINPVKKDSAVMSITLDGEGYYY